MSSIIVRLQWSVNRPSCRKWTHQALYYRSQAAFHLFLTCKVNNLDKVEVLFLLEIWTEEYKIYMVHKIFDSAGGETICSFAHTWAHRGTLLVSVAVIDGGERVHHSSHPQSTTLRRRATDDHDIIVIWTRTIGWTYFFQFFLSEWLLLDFAVAFFP